MFIATEDRYEIINLNELSRISNEGKSIIGILKNGDEVYLAGYDSAHECILDFYALITQLYREMKQEQAFHDQKLYTPKWFRLQEQVSNILERNKDHEKTTEIRT